MPTTTNIRLGEYGHSRRVALGPSTIGIWRAVRGGFAKMTVACSLTLVVSSSGQIGCLASDQDVPF
jgi:hypothetical protein